MSKAGKTGNGQAVGKSSFQPFVAEGLNHRGERVRDSGGSIQSALVGSGLPIGAVRLRAGHSAVLQRKCACGGAADMSGECAECRKKRRLGLQTKLKVNDPGDIYEQEANRIADQVMAAPAHSVVSRAPSRGIQRFSGPSNGQVDAAPASVDQTLASGGRPLEAALRHDMQQRFGHDFSSVRIHTGAQAHDSARSLRALAYTVGNDVVFGAGQYAPETRAGRSLIAHELTHVVQQGGGRGTAACARHGAAPARTRHREGKRAGERLWHRRSSPAGASGAAWLRRYDFRRRMPGAADEPRPPGSGTSVPNGVIPTLTASGSRSAVRPTCSHRGRNGRG